MKEFNVQAGDGELIIHLSATYSDYTITYESGNMIFESMNRRYIMSENIGNQLAFFEPDPDTGTRIYDFENVLSLHYRFSDKITGLNYVDLKSFVISEGFTGLAVDKTNRSGTDTSYINTLNTMTTFILVFNDRGRVGVFTVDDRINKYANSMNHSGHNIRSYGGYIMAYGNHNGGGNYNHSISANSFTWKNSDFSQIAVRDPDGSKYSIYLSPYVFEG